MHAPLAPLWGVERVAMAMSPPRCARLFVQGYVYGQLNGACCLLSLQVYRRFRGAFKFNGCRQWSPRPQPRGSGGDTTPRKDTRGEHWRCPAQVPSGCRVSFKVLVSRSCPVKSMPNSAGQFPVRWSTRAKGLRLCYTGCGRRVHALIGSVSCGLDVRSIVRSRGRSCSTDAKDRVESTWLVLSACCLFSS